MMFEGEMGYLRRYADNLWIFVPIQMVMRVTDRKRSES
jgi:hypothetical protein